MNNGQYKPSPFKYVNDGLTEDQIKDLCKEFKRPYVKGEHQKLKGYIQFKIWHKREMDKRDSFILREKNDKKNFKI